MANEERIKHYEFIQNIITRLNSNSFMIKGWSITVTTALLAFATSTSNNLVLIIAFLPVIAFWILDTIYLRNERKFRSLYSEAIKEQSSIGLFEINVDKDFINNDPKNSFYNVFKSDTIVSFHLSLLILTIACIFLLQLKKAETLTNKPLNIIVNDTIRVKAIDKRNCPCPINGDKKCDTIVLMKKK